MNTKLLLEYANIAEFVVGIFVLLVMWRKLILKQFPLLALYLVAQSVDLGVSIPLLFFRRFIHISIDLAYNTYLAVYWASYAVQAVLLLLIIHSVFSLAMRPLEGLHEIGKIIFRWVVAVSIALSLCISAGSLLSPSSGMVSTVTVTTIASQVQQGICVLTLCLLLFVCFAAKPLGLTFRSRIFGVSLGLGALAATNLVEAAWYSTSGAHSLYSPVYLVGIGGCLVALAVWGTYFVLPEPERKMILLPTTSPFFFWNRVSEALGDAPGNVAVAGFKPDMLAPGELTMLTAMSKAAREREEQEAEAERLEASSLPMALHSAAR